MSGPAVLVPACGQAAKRPRGHPWFAQHAWRPPPHAAADTQGDISQARGQLGQLLFEFSQIELNRDLLEAIKRTESKTGEAC